MLKRSLIAAALLFAATAGGSQAQTASRNVRVIVPYGAGGFIDSVARGYAQAMSQELGQTWIVENKVGAGGKIGEEFTAQSAPDGSTLLVSLVLRPTLARATAPDAKDIDMLESFALVGALGSTPLLMSAPPSLGVKTFPELVAKIKAEPGKHSYGSPGVGTPGQIAGAMIVKKFGLDIAHVPYRGGAAALPDLMSGVISWLIDTPTGSGALVESGKVVPMFVADRKRVRDFPEIPSILELGHPEFAQMISTIFLMAPAKTPDAMMARYHAALMKAQGSDIVTGLLRNLRLTPPEPGMSRADATAAAQSQIDLWSRTIKELE